MNGLHVSLSQLSKTYQKAGHTIRVLREVDLELEAGSRVAVRGPSGVGKSTFLHLIGVLDTPNSGSIRLSDREVSSLGARQRARLRNRRIGFVFQSHNLLPEHSALDNVSVPVRLAGGSARLARERAQHLLDVVGLAERLEHRPGELSGGEQQRVALARALVMGPGLVLADEPTGNLDPRTAQGVFELMLDLNEQLGSTLVVVTHSRELAAKFPRRLVMEQGRFHEQ